MTADLFERYASLDPAKAPGIQPEWSTVAPVLSAATDWSEPDMQTQQHVPTQPETPKPKRTGLLVAVSATVLIVFVGTIALLSNEAVSELPPPLTPPTTATTITQTEALAISASYYEAVNAGDVARTMALFDSGAVLTDSYTQGDRTPADQEMQYVWNAALGTKLDSGECTVVQHDTDLAMEVTCRGENLNAIAQALDAPAVPLTITMVVTTDGITSLHEQFGFPDHNVTKIPFMAWMRAHNPDDAEQADFGTWTTIEEAHEFGLVAARYSKEWATYLTTNGCIFRIECVELVDRTPEQVIKAYAAAYNDHDLDAVMAFFTDDSVITSHPFSSESSGIAETRALHITDLAAAASMRAYRLDNVEVTGNTVTWDHEWTNASGEKYCKQGNSAVVKDGTILIWTWPADDGFGCP